MKLKNEEMDVIEAKMLSAIARLKKADIRDNPCLADDEISAFNIAREMLINKANNVTALEYAKSITIPISIITLKKEIELLELILELYKAYK